MAHYIELNPKVVSNKNWNSIVRKLPFKPSRTYRIKPRASNGHIHGQSNQALLCLKGGFTMTAQKGRKVMDFQMQPDHKVLYIGPKDWHRIYGVKRGSIVLCFSDLGPPTRFDFIMGNCKKR